MQIVENNVLNLTSRILHVRSVYFIKFSSNMKHISFLCVPVVCVQDFLRLLYYASG